DPGHDDAVALMLAHAHLQVLGVTTVSGNAPLEHTTRNALAVLELLGADTPVYSGAAQPLAGEPLHAAHVHGASGLGGASLPAPTTTVVGDDAAGFMIEATLRHAGVWIVAIGPLTNVAVALQRDPSLAKRVAGISVMGGSATVGNATAVAEFNVWADPEAAEIVFACGARLKMCGLNLTHQLQTSDAIVAGLREVRSRSADFVADLFDFLHERMADLIGVSESALHDPCAVLAVSHPQLLSFQERAVSVEVAGTHTRGMTVVDQRAVRRSGGKPDAANVEVAYTLDAEPAMALIVQAVTVG
ncbi:MAG: nucleoside hydrolase, partial [Gammaproteobacteria bacterium]|nr:nucleoside hydrolase [Gammaproteobacteria bacterium]